MIGKCKLCGGQRNLVKAHIIPRSFYPERGRGEKPFIVLGPTEEARRGRSHTGIYDNQMVCADCEKLFDPFDDYAAKLLLDRADEQETIAVNGEIFGFCIREFDYAKLKLFGLSTLWRAAATDRKEFAKVRLGPYFPRLTDMVKVVDPGDPNDFSVIICRFNDTETWQSGFLSPFIEKYNEIKYYRFVMGTYVMYIKVDNQRAAEPFRSFVMRPDAPLQIVSRKFHGGSEHRALTQMARGAAQRSK